MSEPIDPDCRDGKHGACPGWTLDLDTDQATDCCCSCHLPDDEREALRLAVMSLTTQTGMPIRDCDVCGRAHPVGREHCVSCGRASAFITPAGACLKCQGGPEPVRFEPPLTRAEADAFWNAITDQTESPDQDQPDRSEP